MIGKILKNSGYLILANFLAKILSFIYTLYLAKELGVNDFGLFVTALAYFSLASALADLGFNRFIVREGAKDEKKISDYLCVSIFTRLSITAIIFSGFALWLHFFDSNPLRVSLSLFAIMAILPQSAAMTFDAALIAKQNLKASAINFTIMSLTTTLLGFLLLQNGYGVFGAVTAITLGQFAYVIANLIFTFQGRINFLTHASLHDFKAVILGSLPYGILGAIGLLSFKIDSIILVYLKGNFEVGIYGAAYRFLEAAVFIPTSFATALFPIVAKMHVTEHKNIETLFFKSIKVSFLVGIFVSLIYITILPIFINYYLPAFKESINVLRVLSLAIPFIFIHIPAGQIILSTDKFLKHLIPTYLALFAVNILLYFIFIPKLGGIGAAIVTVISEAITFITFFIFLKKKVF